jgi:hypothetical protein
MRTKPGTIVAIVGDTHIGGYTALSLPEWELIADENERLPYKANKAGEWLHQRWGEYWSHVKALAAKTHRIVTIHLGDVIDGFHHNTLQAMPNTDDQVEMAAEIMTQVANISKGALFVCMGTEAHAGRNGADERKVVQRAGGQYAPDWTLDIDGLIIRAYHHGGASKSFWTSAGARLAAEAQIEAVQTGQPIPRYVFAGHNHVIDDSGEKVTGTRYIACPSWQLKTAFGHRVARGRRSDIGGLIILPDGSLDWSQARYMAAPGQTKVVKV